MISNLDREKKLSELYRQILKMQNWADTDNYGYSKEKNYLLDKIYQMRMDCLEADQVDVQEVLDNYNDQANLLWSSIPRRIQ